MKRIALPLVFIFSCLFALSAHAFQRPEAMLESLTERMLVALKQNDSEIKRNSAKLFSIVDTILVPHVDTVDMSRWVAGRNAWLSASESQRSRFANEFKDLMIRTYASSLTAYSNQTITYMPIRGDIDNKKRVQVSSRIVESGRSPINVSYRLVRKGNGWKVYDIIIEGVSLLQGFKSQFAQDIQQSGLDLVIDKMKTHNQKPLL